MKTRIVLPSGSDEYARASTVIAQTVQRFGLTQLLFVLLTFISMRGVFGEFYSASIEACAGDKSMGL